ncbi:hypothetical protein N7520_002303 [Penicillium odoratum]|uniref:uncharacterized protein n=1 Tax=Penicillium odoratum TaxID=1167516 RepID=UPI0025474EE4|nr:uncharacterized protein N7520_002303 [Penicillium odoratum]KAJ5771774.1 hypothetical protein N7520_002303 [Penicillium odoratum]
MTKVPVRPFGSRIGRPNDMTSVVIITTKYLFASAAAANVLQNSIMLGRQTILSWKCTSSYLEIAWVFLALVPLGLSIASIMFESKSAAEQKRKNQIGLFDSLANLAGAGHVTCGTVILSAVLFIGTLDALGVFARFAASALVCQLITVLELDDKDESKEGIWLPLRQGQHTVDGN